MNETLRRSPCSFNGSYTLERTPTLHQSCAFLELCSKGDNKTIHWVNDTSKVMGTHKDGQ